jgi:hypothetical protein
MRVHKGNSGWCLVTGDTGLPGRTYVRVTEHEGTLRVTEVYIDGEGEPIEPGQLRRLGLQSIEDTARYLASHDPELHRHSEATAGPDLSRLATYFSTTFGVRENGQPARLHWVADSMHAQVRGSKVPQAPRIPLPSKAEKVALDEPRLDPREGHQLTDEYLLKVAEAYTAAVAKRMPPAKTLAPMAGVDEKTIHSWVAKARKRGLMPPARRTGRVV